jgi:hypothetical protein
VPVSTKIAALLVVTSASIAASTAICQRLWLVHAVIPTSGAATPEPRTLSVPVGAQIPVLDLNDIRINWA